MRITTRFRHWLLRTIAMGDAVLMNFDFDQTETIRPQNLGPMLFDNIEIRSWHPFGCGAILSRDRVILGDSLEIRPAGNERVFKNIRIFGVIHL